MRKTGFFRDSQYFILNLVLVSGFGVHSTEHEYFYIIRLKNFSALNSSDILICNPYKM